MVNDETPLDAFDVMVEEAKAIGKPPLLMSKENPDGFKLEELIASIIHELEIKQSRIIDDNSLSAIYVLRNNKRALELLNEVGRLQLDTLENLKFVNSTYTDEQESLAKL